MSYAHWYDANHVLGPLSNWTSCLTRQLRKFIAFIQDLHFYCRIEPGERYFQVFVIHGDNRNPC